MMDNQHAQLSPEEQAREASAFRAWLKRAGARDWEDAYADWAIHLLPGDWHRVRRLVAAQLPASEDQAA